jgi:hypothetical protein
MIGVEHHFGRANAHCGKIYVVVMDFGVEDGRIKLNRALHIGDDQIERKRWQ